MKRSLPDAACGHRKTADDGGPCVPPSCLVGGLLALVAIVHARRFSLAVRKVIAGLS